MMILITSIHLWIKHNEIKEQLIISFPHALSVLPHHVKKGLEAD